MLDEAQNLCGRHQNGIRDDDCHQRACHKVSPNRNGVVFRGRRAQSHDQFHGAECEDYKGNENGDKTVEA